MNKKAEFKNNIKFLLLAFGIILAIYFVFGASFSTGNGTPLAKGNFSGSILLNCTTSTINSTGTAFRSNVTFFYNASGGATGNYTSGGAGRVLGVVWNVSTVTNNNSIYNITADISSLTDANGFTGIGYNISCYADNGTAWEVTSAKNITIDNTPPAVSFSGITNTIDNGNYTNTTLVLNVSVSDAIVGMLGSTETGSGNVYINVTNRTGQQEAGNFTKLTNVTGGYYNVTLNARGFADGKYNITVFANESNIYQLINSTGNAVVNSNNTKKIQIAIDRTAPSSVTIANTTSTTTTSIVATITAADATSGIDNCAADTSGDTVTITGRGAGTQTLTHTGLTCATIYKYIITCYDQIGNNLASAQTSLSTSPCTVSDSGSNSGGSGGGSSKTQSWTKITPGAATIMKNFNKDTGVKEISVEVNNPAQNVNIIVTKYDGKPAEVSVEKSGKVYKYLQIKETNLEKNLSKAIVKIQVEKSWITSNSLDKTKIALFKFKDGNWQELTTTFAGEDTTYDYYTTDLTSFSYFAIGEKTVTPPLAEEGDEVDSTGGEEGDVTDVVTKSNRWWWVVIGVLIVVIGAGLAINKINRKKRHHKFGY